MKFNPGLSRATARLGETFSRCPSEEKTFDFLMTHFGVRYTFERRLGPQTSWGSR